MPASVDIPDAIGFELDEAAAHHQGRKGRPSWFVEFITAPFRDLDGRASWRQERAEREKRRRARSDGPR